MATTQQNTHSHHRKHTNRMDGSSRFKYESLKAIRRRKLWAKWGFRLLFLLAVLAVIALIAAYTIG